MNTQLAVGTKVRVTRTLGGLERHNLGVEGEIVRYSKPHGYAVLKTDTGECHVHLEAIDPVE